MTIFFFFEQYWSMSGTAFVIIMSNVVFSFTGVVLVMAVLSLGVSLLPEGWIQPERSMITMMSFIALVGLTGIVVNDAIVLMDFINRRRQDGHGLREARCIETFENWRLGVGYSTLAFYSWIFL